MFFFGQFVSSSLQDTGCQYTEKEDTVYPNILCDFAGLDYPLELFDNERSHPHCDMNR
jgi:hypothetical protein